MLQESSVGGEDTLTFQRFLMCPECHEGRKPFHEPRAMNSESPISSLCSSQGFQVTRVRPSGIASTASRQHSSLRALNSA